MNILPFIFAFLIIFSSFAFNSLKDVKSFFLAEVIFDSYNRVEKGLQNFTARKTYSTIKGEALQGDENKSTKQQKKKSCSSYRTLFPPLETSKFNFTPLIKTEGEFKLHPLYEPLAELLRILYQKNLFGNEKSNQIEYRILETLLAKARKNPEMENLSDLIPDDPEMKGFFYKMLKGTNQYVLEGKGIPPLGDFLSMRQEPSAISFPFASRALLQALFGKELTSQILNEEQKKTADSGKHYTLPKEELQALLMKNPTLFSIFSALDPYIDYSKQIKSRKERAGKDDKTGLSIKKLIDK